MQLSNQQDLLIDGTPAPLDGQGSHAPVAARPATRRLDHLVTLCENVEALDALAAEWNQLLDGAHHKSAFLKHQWMSTWWRLIGSGAASRQLFVLLARASSGALEGVLPLYRETLGHGPFRRRVLRFLGSAPEAPEHLDVIVREANAASIVDALVAGLGSLRSEYDSIELLDLAESSLLLPALTHWSRSASHAYRSWVWQECPYVATEGSFDKYLMTLTQKHRYTAATEVTKAEVVLGVRITLLGGLAIPLHRFLVILSHATAIGVRLSQIVLGSGVVLLGGFAIPFHRLPIIRRHTLATAIAVAEIVLSPRVILFRGPARPLHRP